MRTTKADIGVIANCQNCDWETQDYIKGLKLAKNHAKTKRHKVSIEVTRVVEIDGSFDWRII